MKRKRKKRVTRRVPLQLFVSLAILVSFAVTGIAVSRSNTPLNELPVPRRLAAVNYSGPLTLEHVNQSVLGAETIDPLDFISEINKERTKTGSPNLRLSTVLMKAAKLRADVIMKHQNFSHQDPFEGIELATVLPKLNYHFVYATENIGMGGVSAPDFVNGFMHSDAHRANLLDPTLTETGAAVVSGKYDKWYVNVAVQLFAIPGGVDEYRGYTDEDRTAYERSLTAVSSRLNPVVWTVNALLNTPGYDAAARDRLSRQKTILETVLVKIRKDERLENPDVALILEYNSLL